MARALSYWRPHARLVIASVLALALWPMPHTAKAAELDPLDPLLPQQSTVYVSDQSPCDEPELFTAPPKLPRVAPSQPQPLAPFESDKESLQGSPAERLPQTPAPETPLEPNPAAAPNYPRLDAEQYAGLNRGGISVDDFVAQNSAPDMIGDYFSPGNTFIAFRGDNLIPGGFSTQAPTGGAQSVGFAKIAENGSPLPRDRVFFNYSNFNGVPLTAAGASVKRYTPGFEKTFFDRNASVELRLPMASTLGPDLAVNGNGALASSDQYVFGDMALYFKGLLWANDRWALTGGLQLNLPTAPTLRLDEPLGQPLLRIKNEAVHAMPFFGALFTPNDRFFAQAFLQYDVDTNGNPVQTISFNAPGALTAAGRLQDPTFMYASLSGGYWLKRDRVGGGLTGFAPIFEAHYNTSLQANDAVFGRSLSVGSNYQQVSVLNATIGCFLEFNHQTTVTLGYSTPIGNGVDQQFDGEFRCFINRRFGGTTRPNRLNF